MYVISEIDESGKVIVNMALTSSENSKYYYFNFESEYDSIVFCDSLFPNQNGYHWFSEAPTILEEQIRNFGPASMRPNDYERKYYSSFEIKLFDHNDYPGMIYYYGNGIYNSYLSPEDMCFYLDSYLGIVVENRPQGYDVVECNVIPHWGNPGKEGFPQYHELRIKYGNPSMSGNHPVYD